MKNVTLCILSLLALCPISRIAAQPKVPSSKRIERTLKNYHSPLIKIIIGASGVIASGMMINELSNRMWPANEHMLTDIKTFYNNHAFNCPEFSTQLWGNDGLFLSCPHIKALLDKCRAIKAAGGGALTPWQSIGLFILGLGSAYVLFDGMNELQHINTKVIVTDPTETTLSL